jgi:hypothetical protein
VKIDSVKNHSWLVLTALSLKVMLIEASPNTAGTQAVKIDSWLVLTALGLKVM